ncbi:MAG: 50S ribosomal protein L25, partial [Gammaproteobacteria bacterium]|nr:50S ribosomal protein L25 [Gammaproteobacteria bacterium]
EIICLPQDLPEYLEVDVGDLAVGESIHISQIKLPKGVTSVDLIHGEDSDHAVATVLAPRGGAATEEGAEA